MLQGMALIGCGNMGSAMVKGIVGAGLIEPEDLVVSNASPAAAEALASALGCTATCDNVEAVRGAGTVLLAVKPQQLPQVARQIAPALAEDALVVSVAAGVTLAHLAELLGSQRKIVRVMPNLPAMVGAGMSSVSPNERVSEEETAFVKRLCEGFGRAEVLPERLIDAVIAASGSSPAFVCLFIEALADAAVAEGMPRAQAYAFAEQAVMGHGGVSAGNRDAPGGAEGHGVLARRHHDRGRGVPRGRWPARGGSRCRLHGRAPQPGDVVGSGHAAHRHRLPAAVAGAAHGSLRPACPGRLRLLCAQQSLQVAPGSARGPLR